MIAVVVILGVLLAVACFFGGLYVERAILAPPRESAALDAALALRGSGVKAEVAHELLMDTLGEAGVRFELVISDFGEDFGEMRWRWSWWDADAVLLNAATADLSAPVGVDLPFMLGNAPTRAQAEAEALAWLVTHSNGSPSLVVRD